MRRGLAVAAWCAVTLGLFNAGLPHERFRAVERAVDAGRWPGTLAAARAYLTNDGDVRRYLAYCDAALGRPYLGYFIRPVDAWRRAFAAEENRNPDEIGRLAPGRRLTPYRDFLVEYPPGFFLVALPLARLTADPYAYLILFGAWMALLLTAALLVGQRLVARLGAPVPAARLFGWAAAAALALGIVTTHRYDAAVALPLAAAAWALAARRPILLGLAAGIAVAAKLVPVVALPLFVLHYARERRFRELAFASLVAALTVAAIALPAVRAAGDTLVEIARYHRDRPLQIESTWAALLGLLGGVQVTRTFGSTNVVGRGAGALLALSTGATAAALLATYAFAWRRLGRADEAERARTTAAGTVATLAALIVLGKVASPQYLVWLLPLGLALTLADGRRLLLALLIVACALTQVIYPISYPSVEALARWACALVLARNLALAAWAVLLLVGRRR